MSPGQRQDHVPAAATGARPAPSAASAAPAAPSRQDEVSPPVSRPGSVRIFRVCVDEKSCCTRIS